jgi:hypothetical protein
LSHVLVYVATTFFVVSTKYFFSLSLSLSLSLFHSLGSITLASAQEDDNDDIVDVEGEENSIVTDEEADEDLVTASKDVVTTILFTEPIHNPLSTLGKYAIKQQNFHYLYKINNRTEIKN